MAYYFTSAPPLSLVLMQPANLQHLHIHRHKPHNRQDKHESNMKNSTLAGEL